MIDLIQKHAIPTALAILPAEMGSTRAKAMLLAIGLQESKFLFRHQVGGPARGFWQFEKLGGIRGVMLHPRTHEPLVHALRRLRYASIAEDVDALHAVVEHNDVVACVFARLLLWTVPGALPSAVDPISGWGQYIAGWRPGKPHPDSWQAYYAEAWARAMSDDKK